MNVIIPLLVLSLFYFFDLRKSKKIQISTIVIGIYFLSVASSVFLPLLYDKYSFYYNDYLLLGLNLFVR